MWDITRVTYIVALKLSQSYKDKDVMAWNGNFTEDM